MPEQSTCEESEQCEVKQDAGRSAIGTADRSNGPTSTLVARRLAAAVPLLPEYDPDIRAWMLGMAQTLPGLNQQFLARFTARMLTTGNLKDRLTRWEFVRVCAGRAGASVVPRDGARACRKEMEVALAEGAQGEKKQIPRAWVSEVKTAPESLAVGIRCQIPEPAVDNIGTGVGFGFDSESKAIPLVSALWSYAEAKRGGREMRRIGLSI